MNRNASAFPFTWQTFDFLKMIYDGSHELFMDSTFEMKAKKSRRVVNKGFLDYHETRYVCYISGTFYQHVWTVENGQQNYHQVRITSNHEKTLLVVITYYENIRKNKSSINCQTYERCHFVMFVIIRTQISLT